MKQNPSVTFTPRDLVHFLVSSGGAYVAYWYAQGQPTNPKAAWALIPGFLTVLFRKTFPNMGNLKPVPPTLPPSGGVAS